MPCRAASETMLASEAEATPNDQQEFHGFWNFTGVTTPSSRRSNAAGRTSFERTFAEGASVAQSKTSSPAAAKPA